jgi:hypothetical protein
MVVGKKPADEEVWASFIEAHADLDMMESGKCRCKLTGHEMVPHKAVVEAHLNGKKYTKARAQEVIKKYDFAQHQPHIVENKRDQRKLFCHRTKLHLNKVPEEVQTHVQGRRFRARLQEWEEKQVRRAAKAARTQQKADDRAARKAAITAGSDNEEDPVLAQFASFNSESEDDISSSDEEVPHADSDAEGGGEQEETRSAKEQYKKGRAAAQALAKQPALPQGADDDAGSDFEVVAAAESSGGEAASSEEDDMQVEDEEDDESEPEPEPTDAKRLSMARIAARQERDDASFKSTKPGKSKKAKVDHKVLRVPEPSAKVKEDDDFSFGDEEGDWKEEAKGASGENLPALWHHGTVVADKHHGRSGDRHHGRSRGGGGGASADLHIKSINKKPKFSGGRGGAMRGGGFRGRGGGGRGGK